jgi:prephenate dehydratase
MTKRLAFLGPAGSYSEQASLDHEPEAALLPFASIPAVAAAVDSGHADEGVVPIENSLEGSVTEVLDVLIHESNLFIRHELVVPINHCLLAKPGTRTDDIKVIYSHPQALGQCRSFLGERFPGAALIASLSTSAAVQEMNDSEAVAAAIANARAATLYGAQTLAQDIQDTPNNLTRFVVLAPSDHPPTGSDKTSFCFEFDDDASGILYSVLGEFARRHINLAKIESRPTRRSLGRYVFLVDLEGHREDGVVREALEAVRAQVSMLKVFGSYPMHVSSSV